MEYLAASGVCIAVLVGSVLYESRKMRREEEKARKLLRTLAEKTFS